MGQMLRHLTAGTGKKISLELGGKSPFIVFESADIDGAVEGLVDAIWFNQGQVCSAGSRVLVHESIHDTFVKKVKARMTKLRVSDSLDKSTDIGAIVDPAQVRTSDSVFVLAHVISAKLLSAMLRLRAKREMMCSRRALASLPKDAFTRRHSSLVAMLVYSDFNECMTSLLFAEHVNCGSGGDFWTSRFSDAIPYPQGSHRSSQQHTLRSWLISVDRKHIARTGSCTEHQGRNLLDQQPQPV